jgi:uncharacterized integral membrane protein (TIGR00697 family)
VWSRAITNFRHAGLDPASTFFFVILLSWRIAPLLTATETGYAFAMTTHALTLAGPRALFAFSIFYGGMVCIAGVLANKQVALGPLAVEAGIFAFLLLVVASSAVAELYGRDTANRLVAIGFAPLIFSILLAIFVLALPPAHDMQPERLSAFNTIMGGTPRIWIAGIIAYGVSQFLNVTIFSALRGKGEGRMIWLRAGIAGILSQIVDTLLFISISFYGEFPIRDLLLGQMLAKVVLSAVLIPPLVQGLVAVGRRMDARGAV